MGQMVNRENRMLLYGNLFLKKERKKMNGHNSGLIKQKLLGVFILIVTFIAIPIMDGDATFALFTIPLALFVIFSKTPLLDESSYEDKETEEEL